MVYREAIHVHSNDRIQTFHDVTAQAREIVQRSGIRNGLVSVYSHHTTCCVITQEEAFDMSMTGLETVSYTHLDVYKRQV